MTPGKVYALTVRSTVFYKPCSACGQGVPIRVEFPGGSISRSHRTRVSCNARCRAVASKARRAGALDRSNGPIAVGSIQRS